MYVCVGDIRIGICCFIWFIDRWYIYIYDFQNITVIWAWLQLIDLKTDYITDRIGVEIHMLQESMSIYNWIVAMHVIYHWKSFSSDWFREAILHGFFLLLDFTIEKAFVNIVVPNCLLGFCFVGFCILLLLVSCFLHLCSIHYSLLVCFQVCKLSLGLSCHMGLSRFIEHGNYFPMFCKTTGSLTRIIWTNKNSRDLSLR